MNDTIESSGGASPSGRFVLRIDPGLHAALRDAAAGAGLSLNEYCARMLAGGVGGAGFAPQAVSRARAVLGGDLVGVVAYGSWARGEAGDLSDIDLLLVVADGRAVTRALYRLWDERPVEWLDAGATGMRARKVEPHFVHLPPAGEIPSGTWAELALDGIVLFDPDLIVSRRLIEIRTSLVAGDLVRREVHGQPYWAEAR